MNNQTNIEKLITSGKHVFTVDDLAVLWDVPDRRKLVERIKYYVRRGRLTHMYKGLYGYGEVTSLEVAQKLVPMSYISLATASRLHGLSFQYDPAVYCVAPQRKAYDIGGQAYRYHRIKPLVFYQPLGLIDRGQYTLAGPERTICDTLYLFPGAGFDNLTGVDAKLLADIARLYDNKRLRRDVAVLCKQIEKEP